MIEPSFISRCSRRDWFRIAVLCTSVSRLRARELSGFYYRQYSKCLPDYLSSLARAAYEKRNRALALLTDAVAIRERQTWVSETFWKLIGGKFERTPLNGRVTGRFDRPAYSVEKIVYQSRPGLFVSANLYIPKTGTPPYPGVLFQMGHSGLGKAYSPYQKCCQGLAQLGYLVLAFDPMGQGERIAYPDSTGLNTRFASVDEEHNVPGKQLLLLGQTATQYQLWDAIRSLDYLASHSLVDPVRLGCTGQSGGGTVTMLLACVDDRLSAVVVCSGNTENVACADFDPPGSTDDAEQDLIGAGVLGFDRWDLLYPLAPKPLLIQVSAHDFFGTYSPSYLSSGREEYDKLLGVYRTLGHPDRLGWGSTPIAHALSYELRLDLYNWFERWLRNSERRITEEPAVAPEAASTLWTGATGNVVRDYQSLRPFDLIQRAAAGIRRNSESSSLMQTLNVIAPAPALAFRKLAQTPLPGVRVHAAEVQSSAQVWMPVWLFVPDSSGAGSAALIVVDDRGRDVEAHEDGLYHRLARAGHPVCAADIRGVGDSRPEAGRGNPAYTIPHDSEEDYAWSSLILGSSLLAQRITDVLALIRACKNDDAGRSRRLVLAARGGLTVPTLFAFAISKEIESLYLAEGLISFQSLLETEVYDQPFGSFAWNLFRLTDLPLLAASAAPRPIHLAGAVNAAGKPAPPAQVRAIYSSSNVTMSGKLAWDETLLSLLQTPHTSSGTTNGAR